MEAWKIQKERGRCDKPGCPLAGESEFFAVLQLPECIRVERCKSCFEEMRLASSALPFHWLVRRTARGDSKPSLDLESLRALFDRLGETAPEPDAAPPEEPSEEPAEESAQEPAVVVEAEADAETEQSPREVAAGLRYLVALLLLRKRRLKMVDPQTEEQEQADLVVVDPKIAEMEPVSLVAPPLDPDRLGSLREELMAAIGEDTGQAASTAS